MKKRSFVYWGMFFILLSMLITPFLKLETGYAQTEPTSTSETNQISATPNVVPRKQVGNIVTAIQLTDKEGNPLGTINQYTDIYLRIEFNLPDNTVNSGDTSVITLPEELRLEKNMTFNVVDDTGAVVAIAQTDVANKTVTLTYTDYVENHANISGSLYFTSLIDFENVENESKIPIYVTVEGEKYLLAILITKVKAMMLTKNLASIRGLSKTIQPKFTMYYGLIQQGKRILI